ncbi:unnamed protein product [Aphanomyces euteiches]|uniref:Protein phosphatase inhibitor 2 n=1 Tax=Aphanomyces euteiches TaxID=100861 RepID=A0A6G0XD36_9STRA|nr:hypothetical protein Ae201684_006066 [Aphanomyces euteiches]KAH9069042.1 hypothetical protein Ae201684P_004739 [Aphanomyces euteiches]KAH9153886.1 hypothetical protein AeRB84_003928 [Aphanomyces euteiches]
MLKKDQGTAAADAPRRPRIKWDEETITLHDLDRGTRMKIDEPNTPYHYYSESAEGDAGIEISEVAMEMHDAMPENAMAKPLHAAAVSPAHSASNGKELQWDELQSKLKQHASEWDSDSDASSTSSRHRTPSQDKAFSQKRKQHYNEFERVKQWRKEHANDTKDEEEEDE